MSDPKGNIGKICKSMEKYYDIVEKKMKVKSRPALIIGCEPDYASPMNIDYELLPISTLKNITPNKTYDFLLEGELHTKLGLTQICYIRTHKITWNHVKNMIIDEPLGSLADVDPSLFNDILGLNKNWVLSRNESSMLDAIDFW